MAYIEERGPHNKDKNWPLHYGARYCYPGWTTCLLYLPGLPFQFLTPSFTNNTVPIERGTLHRFVAPSSNEDDFSPLYKGHIAATWPSSMICMHLGIFCYAYTI